MDTNEAIKTLESEMPVKYIKIENISMGKSIHFSYNCDKEQLSSMMKHKFGIDFVYIDNDACFFITNGIQLKELKV